MKSFSGAGATVYSFPMTGLISVVIGAVIGASGRYLIGGWLSRLLPGVFPWGTLAVNWLGCLAIGVAWGISQRAMWAPGLRTFLFIGVLGSFTTFSSFGLETLNLVRGGETVRALAYVFGSNLGGLFLVWLGLALVRG